MKICCIIGEDLNEDKPCGKPGVASIDWPDGGGLYTRWYCAEHYDLMIERIKESGRISILKGTGIR